MWTSSRQLSQALDRQPHRFSEKVNPLKENSTTSAPIHWWADLSLLVTVLLWGINLPVMKFALEHMDKFSFNAIRLTISTVALGIIVACLKAPVIDRSETAKPKGQQWMNVVLFSILTGFGYQILFLIGINSTSAGNTGLILSAIPMWTAVLAFFFLRERLSRGSWMGLAIAILGVLVVTLSKPTVESSTNTLSGNLLVSLAAFSWAAASVWSMPMMRNISPVALTFYSILFSLPLHYMMAWNGLALGELMNNPKLTLAVLYSGVFSTGIASALWNYGLKIVGPSHAAGFQNLVPIIALASSWLLLGEVPFAMQLGGGIMIIAGLVVMRIAKRRSNQARHETKSSNPTQLAPASGGSKNG